VKSPSALPTHYALTRGQVLVSSAALVAAFLLLSWLGWRLAAGHELWRWWTVPALIAGLMAADFASGLVHWAADTWGRDDWPVVGPRLLVPFRVHHINPDDFLRRRFVDANGEVAMIAVPVTLGLLAVPLEPWWGGPIAVFGGAFCGVGTLTNQIHQWAHMPAPPRVVRAMQRCGVLLDRDAHAAHHATPYDRRYCITTGWCNRPLDALGFFRRLELLVTRVTGAEPRHDDRRYDARYTELPRRTDSLRA
jgi:hypothetical protein